jgi:hypothetical protein
MHECSDASCTVHTTLGTPDENNSMKKCYYYWDKNQYSIDCFCGQTNWKCSPNPIKKTSFSKKSKIIKWDNCGNDNSSQSQIKEKKQKPIPQNFGYV